MILLLVNELWHVPGLRTSPFTGHRLCSGLLDRQFSPFIGLSYNMGGGQNSVAQLTSGNGVDFRTRVPLSRRFQMEVRPNTPQSALRLQAWVGADSICLAYQSSSQLLSPKRCFLCRYAAM